jgi:zinc and cadmium transporter
MNSFTASPPVLLALYCTLVLLASLAGGWLLLALRLTHARLQTALSFVAGLMLAMALIHFIPHAFHQIHSLDRIVQWVLGGFLVMFFLQRFFPYHHHDFADTGPEEDDAHPETPHDHASHHHHHDHGSHRDHSHPGGANVAGTARRFAWGGTALGMTLHSLMDGVALAAAVAADMHGHGRLLGLGAALVIIFHRPFDAMVVSTMMVAGGCSRFSRHLVNALFALVTPLGMVLFYLGARHVTGDNPAVLGAALAFCAGTFLCIAGADLLPELQFHTHDRVKLSLALLAGIGVALLIGLLETSGHDRHQEGAWGAPGWIHHQACARALSSPLWL